MLRKILLYMCCFILFLPVLNNCNGGGGGASIEVIDDTPPTLRASPILRPITNTAKIVLSFSETIDTATLVLGGDLATESNGGIWSSVDNTDDTLTISANANWGSGLGRSLIIDARDLAGNAMTGTTLNYDIYNAKIYFVSSTASNDSGNALSPETARKTITSVIDLASSPAVIVVNSGDFTVNSDASLTPSHIILKEGVSLYGSYNRSFTNRDTASFTSTITDKSAYVTANNNSPNRVIEAGSGITAKTVIDGFTLNGSNHPGADYTAVIFAHSGGSPSIEHNTINGGAGSQLSVGLLIIQSSAPEIFSNTIDGGSATSQSRAIDNLASSPLIKGNVINGGTGGGASGVVCRSNSNPLISENQISGGNGAGESTGLYSSNSAPTITSNSINGGGDGDGTLATIAVYNDSASSPVVSNNIIHGGNGSTASYGIFNVLASASVFNNRVYGGDSNNASYGIVNGSSTTIIRNNTIDGGRGMNAYGITFNSDPVTIDNNIIFTSGGLSADFCLYEGNATADPASVRNNNLFDCATALYLDYKNGFTCGSSASCITSITDVDLMTDTNASGNIATNPRFEDIDGDDNDISTMPDNDWHFSTLSPGIITAGGLNGIDEGGWGFTDDADEESRPASGSPWSIGAYEP